MIKTLRQKQEVVFYENLLSSHEEEKKQVKEFLEKEYEEEALNYPFVSPSFHKESALKGAEFIYIAAQLILYRKNNEVELENLLPPLDFEQTQEVILSLDLCLRFVPDLIIFLKSQIDPEDALIKVLETQLKKWHYSGIKYNTTIEDDVFKPYAENECLKQLYLNRIVSFKNNRLANKPLINKLLFSNMGMYSKEYWSDLKSITADE